MDTMIFANVNESTRTVTLISVPRDLYWHDAKINSVYSRQGVDAQVAAVEDVLGYDVDRYALVDMYAFRDIIDEMGGVDVTLKEDLIDPTYRTCDNGVCSTLYYEAGTYHLNGTQALRIARSRHTSSDYSRAERQQLILEGLRQKAQTLGFGDAATLISIIQTILDSTETNFTAQEALTDYFRYQSFAIEGGNVISTANVLMAVPVPVNYLTSHPITSCPSDGSQPDCKVQYAIDTLQPRNQNWNLLRWWAREVLSESSEP